MKVLEYLNNKVMEEGLSKEQALSRLEDYHGVMCNSSYEGLLVLNYHMTNSNKSDEIACECRSLVIEYIEAANTFVVVSRSFDRFFNYGEKGTDRLKIYNLVVHEKLDGSIVTVFKWRDKLLYRTRSVIMPVGKVMMGVNTKWNNLIEGCLGDFNNKFKELSPLYSLVFEVTSPDNLIVHRYEEHKMFLLGVRCNRTGVYLPDDKVDHLASTFQFSRPKRYQFKNLLLLQQQVKELPSLEEGYVLYDVGSNIPLCKVKNPAYVTAHRIKAEGLTPDRVMDLIILEKVDEYVDVYPKSLVYFTPYKDALDYIEMQCSNLMERFGEIEDNKEFALKVKDYPVACILFFMRKGTDYKTSWDNLSYKKKYTIINKYLWTPNANK